mgnify:CR=1 FL=1
MRSENATRRIVAEGETSPYTKAKKNNIIERSAESILVLHTAQSEAYRD